MMKVLTRISAVEAGKVKRHPGAGDTCDFCLFLSSHLARRATLASRSWRTGRSRDGEMIVKVLRAGLNSSSGHVWPPGLGLPTSALQYIFPLSRAVGRCACWKRQPWSRCVREALEMFAAPSTTFSSYHFQVKCPGRRRTLACTCFHCHAWPFLRVNRQRAAEQKRQISTSWNEADEEDEVQQNKAVQHRSCDWGQGRVSVPV